MIVEAADSRVLVQTQGNIVLRVEKEPRRGWGRFASFPTQAVASGFAWSVGLAGLGIVLAFGAHRATDQSLLKSLEDLQMLQRQQDEKIRLLTEQSERNAEIASRLARVDDAVSAIPDQVDQLLLRSTSVLAKSISELKYRPTLPALGIPFAPAAGSDLPVSKPRALARHPRARVAGGSWSAGAPQR